VIASDQLVTALATAAFPTFAVLIGILVNNQRLNDFARAVDVRFTDLNRHIDEATRSLRNEIERLRREIESRIIHLEERFES
jgi:hypothetical protein